MGEPEGQQGCPADFWPFNPAAAKRAQNWTAATSGAVQC